MCIYFTTLLFTVCLVSLETVIKKNAREYNYTVAGAKVIKVNLKTSLIVRQEYHWSISNVKFKFNESKWQIRA